MSDHPQEQVGIGAGAVDEPADAPSGHGTSVEPSTLAILNEVIGAPSIAPDPAKPAPETSEPKAPRIEKAEAEGGQIGISKASAARSNPERDPKPGMLIVMDPSDSSRGREDFSGAKATETGDKRRLTAMAAVVALAAAVGAISGAIATVGVMSFALSKVPSSADDEALKASVARLDSDVATLKTNLDQGVRAVGGQSGKTNDRLDKLETRQTESRVKLGQLSEAVDKLRAAPAATAPAPAPAKEATGSTTPPRAPTSAQAAAPASAKPEVARLPTVEGWRVLEAGNGGALIEGRAGVFEVYPGNPVPGLGRIDAIRRQDGRWVVVTSKGLVVAR